MTRTVDLDIALEDIPDMPFHDIYSLYVTLFNRPNKCTRKEFYIWQITNRLQELRFGGLDRETRQLLENMDEDYTPKPERNVPVGVELIKKYKGETYKVKVLKKLKDIHEVETVRVGNALLIKLPNYLKYMSLPDKKKGKSARPQPEENPEPIPDESTNKESKEGNSFIRKENLYRPQVFSNNSNGGLRSIGSIFAQQVKSAFPYHFNEFPPDENEVRRYVAEKDLNVDVDRFFDHYYSTVWCNKKGRRLDGWHFALYHCEKTGEWL